jgi:hypothetical protein
MAGRGNLTQRTLRRSTEFTEKRKPRTQAEAYATGGGLF